MKIFESVSTVDSSSESYESPPMLTVESTPPRRSPRRHARSSPGGIESKKTNTGGRKRRREEQEEEAEEAEGEAEQGGGGEDGRDDEQFQLAADSAQCILVGRPLQGSLEVASFRAWGFGPKQKAQRVVVSGGRVYRLEELLLSTDQPDYRSVWLDDGVSLSVENTPILGAVPMDSLWVVASELAKHRTFVEAEALAPPVSETNLVANESLPTVAAFLHVHTVADGAVASCRRRVAGHVCVAADQVALLADVEREGAFVRWSDEKATAWVAAKVRAFAARISAAAAAPTAAGDELSGAEVVSAALGVAPVGTTAKATATEAVAPGYTQTSKEVEEAAGTSADLGSPLSNADPSLPAVDRPPPHFPPASHAQCISFALTYYADFAPEATILAAAAKLGMPTFSLREAAPRQAAATTTASFAGTSSSSSAGRTGEPATKRKRVEPPKETAKEKAARLAARGMKSISSFFTTKKKK